MDPVLEIEQPYNIGISTNKFGDGALLVVDVDNKDDKKGNETIIELELEGKNFPKTLTQKTPSGGFHYIYSVSEPVKQAVELFGKKSGIDIRSRGGLFVGAGSEIDGKNYLINKNPIVEAPQWLIDKCNEGILSERKALNETTKKVNQKSAKARAKNYLKNDAPIAIEGQGGDYTTFKVVSRIRDFGVLKESALDLLLDNWNDNCQPPWGIDQLQIKIENAFSYAQNKGGVDSPESDFEATEQDSLNPIQKLNEKFSFIVMGGKSTILKHHKNGVDYMTVGAFHDLLKAETLWTGGGRLRQLSELWMASPDRATYDTIQLLPERITPPGVYNLWRGFACKPLGKDEEPTAEMLEGVAMFKEHAFENVCFSDEDLYNWLFGYFAHLIQKPWEKPLVALVFKGEKGVGKNALIDRIGNLLGAHYQLTSNKRYITSNFNQHLASLLLFVLDEAFWSGDKQAEGILKDLITGGKHLIEQKGREMYSTENILRLCIIGNEEWLVPASQDERRFAVFNVGKKRQKDRAFFSKMAHLIDKKGGNRLLLSELKAFNLNTIEVNEAPDTVGLLEQKIESLNPIHSWWLDCLREATILSLDFCPQDWPKEVGREMLRKAYLTHARQRGIRSWLPDASTFGRYFQKAIPEIETKRVSGEGGRQRVYCLPPLGECRQNFAEFIGHELQWEEEESNNVIDAIDLFK